MHSITPKDDLHHNHVFTFNFREVIGFILYWLYLPIFKLKKEQCLSIYMHNPSPLLFEKIIKWLKQNGYKIISLDELNRYLHSENWSKEKLAFISFDDGWQENLKLLPIICKYQTPITIFVTTEPIDSGNYWWEFAIKESDNMSIAKLKQMSHHIFVQHIDRLKKKYELTRTSITEDELIALINNPLVSIQSHTVTHPILTNCTEEEQVTELVSSKEYLQARTNKKIYAFSYPNGNYNDEVIRNVQDAGYKFAFTTEQRHIRKTDKRNLLALPRVAINTNGGYYENISKIITIWQKIIKIRLHERIINQ